MSLIKCWACGFEMTLAEDGLCPKCHAEIILDEPPYDLNGGDLEDELALS